MVQPNIVRRDKASSHPRERGRFYNGIITSVRADGRVNVKIPALNVSYGPVMPLNTTDTSRYVKDDNVLCGFTDENNSQLVIFGSLSPKFDVFATAENGISIYESASARDLAIPSPNEGRVVYVLDTDELQIYNGTEWITVVDTGNSENITASTIVATSASIGSLTVTGASTLTVLGTTSLTSSTSIGSVDSTEIGYLNGVTSNIQTQLNSKSPTASPTFTGTVTIPTLSVTGNTTIGGNLTVNGTTTTINSTVTTIDDPIITLGGDTAPSSDDNKDRGIEFRYHSGTAASVGFFGYDDSTGMFTFLTGATNSSEVFSGTLGTIDIGSVVATGGTITIRPASAQDGIILQGRAGGTSSYAVTLTPGTLSASRTLTFPDVSGSIVTTGDSGTVTSTMIANDTIVNADINSAAAIADTKLATISTAGKVSNAATTATSSNTANAIVSRDASGNFSAGTITVNKLTAGPSAVTMTNDGTLQIGSTGTNFSFGTWASNVTVGILANCSNIWEEAIHDSADRVVSKVYYSGNVLHHGRDLGWGKTGSYFYGGVYGDINYGSYGSISLNGTTNGYSGLSSPGTSSALMFTNNVCGHYYNNNSWNWYFDRGTLRLMGDSNYMLSYVNNNSALPWHYGPYLQGYNGWSYYSTSAGQWEMGHRHATAGGQIYGWVRGGWLVGSQPDDAFANVATLAVKGSGSFTVLQNSTDLDATWQNAGSGNYRVAYQPWSTRKVKKDIGPIGEELNPEKLLDLNVVQFKYIDGYLSETDSIYDKFVCGLIAEEVKDTYPVIVRNDKETGEPQSINYQLLIPPLLGLVQKLSLKIDAIEQKISDLESQ